MTIAKYLLSISVTLYKVLNCFSIIRNTAFIFNTKVRKTDLSYLHGIRVLSLFWIILFHFTITIIPPLGIPFAGKQYTLKFHPSQAVTLFQSSCFILFILFTSYLYMFCTNPCSMIYVPIDIVYSIFQ